jgi:beta-glucanase (GH16 family)
MRHVLWCLLFQLVCLLPLSAQICYAKQIVMTEDGRCAPGTAMLMFNEEFDEPNVDSSVWFFANPWGSHSIKGINYSLEYTSGKNLEVRNGVLSIVVKDEKAYAKGIGHHDSAFMLEDGKPNLRWWDYTSGTIFSKASFGFGKYEIRCKVPKGKGIWSCMMLYGDDNNEIDVFEFWNEHDAFGRYDEKKLATECHMSMRTGDRACPSHVIKDDFSRDFHTYALVWDNYKIEWYIDGVLRRSGFKFFSLLGEPVNCETLRRGHTYIINKSFPLNHLHIAVGLSVQPGEEAPDDKTPFPSSVDIDYIRYWKFD